MSSPEGPDKQDDRAKGESSVEDDPIEDTSEAVAQTTECPNCGRTFVGDYCPSCGQEADPSVSATSVIGGFFRELVDIENGFWPTLVGLTLRPGKTLRRYLQGARAGLATPGRYLLAAVIIGIGTDRLLAWTGVGKDPLGALNLPTAGEGNATGRVAEPFFEALFTALSQWPQFLGAQAWTLSALLVAALLAALLFRLFGESLGQPGEALALEAFLTGHLQLLQHAIQLLYSPAVFFWTGQPAADTPFLLSSTPQIVFIGFAAHRCFGPGWKPALKGAFAAGSALTEAFAILAMGLLGHAAWLAFARPERIGMPGEPPEVLGTVFAVTGMVCAAPLLLHVGVEAYYRLR